MRPHLFNDNGTVAIEFVIVLPFLLLVLFAVVVMGGYMSTKTRTVGAARDGARAEALLQPAPTYPAGITVVRTTPACPPRTDPVYISGSPPFVEVQATSSFSAVNIIGMGTQTITETARMRCGG